MKRAIIFANGSYTHFSADALMLGPQDLLIAADGGAGYCLSFGLFPHYVVGDFDSLSPEQLAALQARGTTLVRHPARKDETDLELALQLANQEGAGSVQVLGALGMRWDMTMANLLLMAHPAFQEMSIRIIDGAQEISLLRSGETVDIHGHLGDILSLLPLCGSAQGITTRGLEYLLENGTLEFGSPRGVSNVLCQEHCQVSLEEGLLLCILIRQSKND